MNRRVDCDNHAANAIYHYCEECIQEMLEKEARASEVSARNAAWESIVRAAIQYTRSVWHDDDETLTDAVRALAPEHRPEVKP